MSINFRECYTLERYLTASSEEQLINEIKRDPAIPKNSVWNKDSNDGSVSTREQPLVLSFPEGVPNIIVKVQYAAKISFEDFIQCLNLDNDGLFDLLHYAEYLNLNEEFKNKCAEKVAKICETHILSVIEQVEDKGKDRVEILQDIDKRVRSINFPSYYSERIHRFIGDPLASVCFATITDLSKESLTIPSVLGTSPRVLGTSLSEVNWDYNKLPLKKVYYLFHSRAKIKSWDFYAFGASDLLKTIQQWAKILPNLETIRCKGSISLTAISQLSQFDNLNFIDLQQVRFAYDISEGINWPKQLSRLKVITTENFLRTIDLANLPNTINYIQFFNCSSLTKDHLLSIPKTFTGVIRLSEGDLKFDELMNLPKGITKLTWDVLLKRQDEEQFLLPKGFAGRLLNWFRNIKVVEILVEDTSEGVRNKFSWNSYSEDLTRLKNAGFSTNVDERHVVKSLTASKEEMQESDSSSIGAKTQV